MCRSNQTHFNALELNVEGLLPALYIAGSGLGLQIVIAALPLFLAVAQAAGPNLHEQVIRLHHPLSCVSCWERCTPMAALMWVDVGSPCPSRPRHIVSAEGRQGTRGGALMDDPWMAGS